MTPRRATKWEWADEWAFNASESDTAQIRMPVAVKRLKAEHARAVRIVKAEIKRVTLDKHRYTVIEGGLILGALETVLNKLQRGR